jgi:hypothetical protein
MLGLGIYVYATCIALAAVVVLMRGISARFALWCWAFPLQGC